MLKLAKNHQLTSEAVPLRAGGYARDRGAAPRRGPGGGPRGRPPPWLLMEPLAKALPEFAKFSEARSRLYRSRFESIEKWDARTDRFLDLSPLVFRCSEMTEK